MIKVKGPIAYLVLGFLLTIAAVGADCFVLLHARTEVVTLYRWEVSYPDNLRSDINYTSYYDTEEEAYKAAQDLRNGEGGTLVGSVWVMGEEPKTGVEVKKVWFKTWKFKEIKQEETSK